MTAPPAGALEACLALLEKATPGSWHAMIRGDYGDGNEADVNGPDGNEVEGAEFTPPGYGNTIRGQMAEADARAIAAAVNLLRDHGPALLAALRLREECEAWMRRIEREADAHTYFADNSDLRMTAGDHAKRAAQLTTIRDDLARALEEGEYLSITPEGIQVKAGQVWIDQDKRMRNRKITVSRVANGFAYYEQPTKNRVSIRRLRMPYWKQEQTK